MQQISVLKASRLPGTMRYFTRKALEASLSMFVVALIASAIQTVLQISVHSGSILSNLSFLYTANPVAAMALCGCAAYSESRYLALTPMPRWSIYTGVLWKMACFVLVSSLLAALHSVLNTALAQALTRMGLAKIDIAVYDFDLYKSLADMRMDVNVARSVPEVAGLAFKKVIPSAVEIFEMCGSAYLYFCLLRRWKFATLAVTIGGPILLVTLFIVPATADFLETLMEMSEAEAMQAVPMLYKMITRLRGVAEWMIERRTLVRAVTALGCYAIAYPVMRGTPQPG